MQRKLSNVLLLVLAVAFAAGLMACGSSSSSSATKAAIKVTPSTGLVTSEAGLTNTIDVTLSTAPANTVTIDVASQDETEVTVDTTPLVFNSTDWNIAQTVTLTGVDDDLMDGDQTISVILNAATSEDPTYAAVAQVTLDVINSDDEIPGVTVSKTSVSVTEGATSATFTVAPNTQPASGEVIVITVTSTDLTEATVDKATLTFDNTNWTAQTVTITGVDDDIVDGDQTFNVTLVIDATATTLDAFDEVSIASVSVTTSDNDAAGVTVTETSGTTAVSEDITTDSFSVAPNTQPASGEVIVITVTSTDLTEATVDTSTLTFDNSNWQTAQDVIVTGVNDDLVDGNQSITITLAIDTVATTANEYDSVSIASVSVQNSDNDAAGLTLTLTGGSTLVSEDLTTDTFTVAPNTQPASGEVIVITVTSTDESEGTVDKATLTFDNTDWMTAQPVTVTGVDDDLADGSQGFGITLAIDTGATTANEYDSVGSLLVMAQNSDNDIAGVTVSTISVSVSETGTSAIISVAPNTQPALGELIVIDVTSLDEGEATVNKSTLTFNNSDWQTAQDVTITGVDDDLVDGNQTFDVTLVIDTAATTANEYDSVSIASVSVQTSDDDIAGITVTETSGSTAVSEDLTTDSFSVAPNTQPASGEVIVITVTSTDESEGTVDKATLTFDNTDWMTAQPVTVTGVDDDLVDGNQSITITLAIDTVATTANEYDSVSIASVSVENSDNDAAGITVSKTSVSVTEGLSIDTFAVVPNTQPAPGEVIVIILASTDESEATVAPTPLTFDNTDWQTAQTITVFGVDDDMADGNQTFDVTIAIDTVATTANEYDSVTIPSVSGQNSDNDTAGITVTETSGTTAVSEGLTTDTFSVAPNTQPALGEVIVIDVASLDGGEGAVSPAQLTFTNADWLTAQDVLVTGVDDDMADGNQTFDVTLAINIGATTANEYDSITIPSVSVQNSDNDTAGVTVSVTGVTVDEAGTIVPTFTVVPNTQPAASEVIVINVISTDEGEATVDKATLTFNNGNWQTAQTVAVTGVDDLMVDGDVVTPVTLTIDTGATTANEYDSVTIASVDVTTTDDDVTEGTSADPVDITGLTPYDGTVDDTADSYYVITGLTIGQDYKVSITGLSADADLYVYDDAFITSSTCTIDNTYNGGTTPEDCTLTALATDMYIQVNAFDAGSITYTLDVAATTIYYMETFANGSGSSADTVLYLYDSDGSTVIASNDDIDFIGGNVYSQLAYPLETGKTYYIEIRDQYTAQDYYSIRLSATGFGGTSAGTVAAIPAPDAYEDDDTYDTGKPLVVDTVQDHSFDTAGESDWFTFTP